MGVLSRAGRAQPGTFLHPTRKTKTPEFTISFLPKMLSFSDRPCLKAAEIIPPARRGRRQGWRYRGARSPTLELKDTPTPPRGQVTKRGASQAHTHAALREVVSAAQRAKSEHGKVYASGCEIQDFYFYFFFTAC